MKLNTVSIALALISTGAFWSAGCAHVEPAAKLTKAQAEVIALHRSKGGTIKSSELETEHGKLIWSVDIAKRGTRNVTEIAVDAKTGEIVAVDVETPADEAAEAKKDAAEKQR